MNQHHHLGHQLLQSLSRDEEALRTLLDTIHAERRALEKRDAKQLNELTQQKESTMADISQRAKERLRLLKQAQLDNDPANWSTTLAQVEKSCQLPLNAQWQKVSQAMEKAQRELSVNEKILGRMQQNVQRLMAALRGEQGQAQTYDADGVARQGNRSLPITRA